MFRRMLYLNFRFLHRTSQWLRPRVRNTGLLVLAGFVIAGAFGVDTRQTMAFQVFALCAVLMLVAYACTPRFRPRVSVRRALPEYLSAEVPSSYTIYVKNHGKRGETCLSLQDSLRSPVPSFREFKTYRDPADRRRNWFDRYVGYPRWEAMLHRKRGADIPAVAMDPIAAGDERSARIALTPAKRGYLRFEHICLLRPDPFGLFNAVCRLSAPESLLVLPKRYAVPRLRMPGQRKYQPGGISMASSVGDSQEVLSLRDYRPGDSPRKIHWRSWAKTGEPVVKELQDEYFSRVALVLDTFSDGIPPEHFEEAVAVAASFACMPRDQETLLDLVIVGAETSQITAGRSLAHEQNLLEILACAEPAPAGDAHRMTAVVSALVAQLSALICVLLAFDPPRRAFVEAMRAAGLPLIVLVIGEAPAAPSPLPVLAAPDRLVFLRPDRVQEDLAQLGALPAPAEAAA